MSQKRRRTAAVKDPAGRDFARKPFYTPAEVARILKISDRTVLERIHRQELYAVQLGPRLYRIPLGALLQFLGAPPEIKWTRGGAEEPAES